MANQTQTTLNISMPQGMRNFIDRRVKEAEYSTPSDYVRALIRADRKRRAEDTYRMLMLEGYTSPAKEFTEKDWKKLEEDIAADVRNGEVRV